MSFRSACSLILIAALLPGRVGADRRFKEETSCHNHEDECQGQTRTHFSQARPHSKAPPRPKNVTPLQRRRQPMVRTRIATASTHATHTTEAAPAIAEATAPTHGSPNRRTLSPRLPVARPPIARLTADLASPRVVSSTRPICAPSSTQLRSLELAPQSGTVRIFQFGDSHTAADLFTGALRNLFQTRFGDAGPGFSLAGYPFAGYRIHGTKHAQSTGWLALGTHLRDIAMHSLAWVA